jgi:hypothetical protein
VRHKQAVLFSIFVCWLTVGCGMVNPGPIPGTNEQVLLPDSFAYARQVKTFKISPAQLKQMIAKDKGENDLDRISDPVCIVGRCYLFPTPDQHKIQLWGAYCDGDTGQWVEKSFEEVPYYVHYDFFGVATIKHF